MDIENTPLINDNQSDIMLRSKIKGLKYQRIGLLFIFILAVAAIIALSVLYVGASSQLANNKTNTTQVPFRIPVGLSQYNSLANSTRGVWRENRQRLAAYMRTQLNLTGSIMLKGYGYTIRNGDVSYSFRQQNDFSADLHAFSFSFSTDRSFFFFSLVYTTGVDITSCWVILDIATGNSTTFVPLFQPHDGVWYGKIKSLAEITHHYDLDTVYGQFQLTLCHHSLTIDLLAC